MKWQNNPKHILILHTNRIKELEEKNWEVEKRLKTTQTEAKEGAAKDEKVFLILSSCSEAAMTERCV